MNDGTAKVTIAGRELTLSPLTLGGLKRQRDKLVVLNELRGRDRSTPSGQLPTALELDAMVSVLGDAAGLIVSQKDPRHAEKFAEFTAFEAEVEALEYVRGITEISDGIVAFFQLTGLKKDTAASGGATGTGEAQGS